MSRHRSVRNICSDEYDDNYDMYGTSVEDDYGISPDAARFIYDRENAGRNQSMGAYLRNEGSIEEGNEMETTPALSDEKMKLESCVAQMKSAVGGTIPEQRLIESAIKYNYNPEKALDAILTSEEESTSQGNLSEIPVRNIKIIPQSSNITRGFEVLPGKDISLLSSSNVNTPRSQSPASGTVTPSEGRGTPDIPRGVSEALRAKENSRSVDYIEQYKKERENEKQHLYMVVIGHVDAGKSTLMGHFLCALGQVSQRIMHKYEQESRKLGKQSFVYAWVLDETGEERERGITMDIGRSQFETANKKITLLDAPGHKDFIPNMIAGAGQADVALLVVDATRGEFETGFEMGGQTREHALLVRSLGVSQLAVVVNKLDTVDWSQARFNEIVSKLGTFLKTCGFRDKDVVFVPCSGLTGQNLIEPATEEKLSCWYRGPCLIDIIDNFNSPERPISKPLRMSVNDVFKGTGSGTCISGRIETGVLNIGDRVLLCPVREPAIVRSLTVDDISQQTAFAGDQVCITFAGGETQNVTVGSVISSFSNPVRIATRFETRIVCFNLKVPITRGFPVIVHLQSLVEPAYISKLTAQLNKSTGEIIKKKPRCLGNNSSALVEITVNKPICVELYSDFKELGRITVRISGVTIAAGLVTKIFD